MAGFRLKRKYEHLCGKCASFPICSKQHIKSALEDTDYCLWEKDYYQPTEPLTPAQEK